MHREKLHQSKTANDIRILQATAPLSVFGLFDACTSSMKLPIESFSCKTELHTASTSSRMFCFTSARRHPWGLRFLQQISLCSSIDQSAEALASQLRIRLAAEISSTSKLNKDLHTCWVRKCFENGCRIPDSYTSESVSAISA